MILLALFIVQTPAEVVARLESKARGVRGIEIECTFVRDVRDPDMAGDHVWGRSRIEADREGTVRDEGCSIVIAPRRERGFISRVIHRYEANHLKSWTEGFAGTLDRPGPMNVQIKWSRDGDPWMSRKDGYSPGNVEPLLLYSLAPSRFFGPPESLDLDTEGDDWLLTSRRTMPYPSRSTFRVRRSDLALTEARFQYSSHDDRWWNAGTFRCRDTMRVGDIVLPREVVELSRDGTDLEAQWRYELRRSGADVTLAGMPEDLYAQKPPASRRATDLRLAVDPADPDALLTIAWGSFHEYGYPEPDAPMALTKLLTMWPRSLAITERLLAGREDHPTNLPAINGAVKALRKNQPEAAAAMAKEQCKIETTPFRSWAWVTLWSQALLASNNAPEATRAWLTLDGDDPVAAAFLAEYAVATGQVALLDLDTLRRAEQKWLATCLRALRTNELAELAQLAERLRQHPRTKALLTAETLGRTFDAPSKEVVPALRAYADDLEDGGVPEQILAAAAVRRAIGDGAASATIDRSLARWREAAGPSDQSGGWVRPTGRMLDGLVRLEAWDQAKALLRSFVDRAVESKLESWDWNYQLRLSALPVFSKALEDDDWDMIFEIWRKTPFCSWDLEDDKQIDKQEFLQAGMRALADKPSLPLAHALLEIVNPGQNPAPELALLAHRLYPDDPMVLEAHSRHADLTLEDRVPIIRKLITASRSGHRVNATHSQYLTLIHVLIKLDRDEEADLAIREALSQDRSTHFFQLSNIIGVLGNTEKDWSRRLSLLDARRNIVTDSGEAINLVERLEQMEEWQEAFGLCLRARHFPSDRFMRMTQKEEALRDQMNELEGRLRPRVDWDALMKPMFDAGPPAAEIQEHLERSLRDLGSDDPELRDKATRILGLIGRPAAPSIRPLLDSQDPELRARSRAILEDIFSREPPAPLK